MRLDFRRRALAVATALVLIVVVSRASDILALASEEEQLFAVLGLKPGSNAADVGAGDGEWSEKLARKVGPSGRVYATEVDSSELDKIRKRVQDAGIVNVTAILGTQQDTGLPEACCDAILVRMVYHHFTEPARMRASLRNALRLGGVLVIVDTEPQTSWRKLEGVPKRGGHGIREDDLVREMTADGFEVRARHSDWSGDDDRYCVVFQRSR